jgi:hypothetical protein
MSDVDGIPAAGNVPGRLVFSTTASGGGANISPRMTIKSDGTIGINNQAPVSGSLLDVTGTIALTNSDNSAREARFYEPSASGSNYTGFKAQAQTANVTYTLPSSDGANGAQLQTDGSGNLSWSSTGNIKYARKSANESVTSSTTLQDDDHLSLSVNANEVWEVEIFYRVAVTSNTNGGVKLKVNFPSGSTIMMQSQAWIGYDASTGYIGQDFITGSYAFYYTGLKTDASGGNVIRIHGVLNVGSTSGNISLQFAQQTSNAVSTTGAQDSQTIKSCLTYVVLLGKVFGVVTLLGVAIMR